MLDFLAHSAVSYFAEQAPGRPALSCAGTVMSYRELNDASNQLAHALLSAGLPKGDPVGIFLNKGLDMGVSMYGVLKAGGVFVPIDPFIPVERLAHTIRDCGVRYMVAGDAQADALNGLAEILGSDVAGPAEGPVVFGIGASVSLPAVPWDEIRCGPTADPSVSIIDQDLAYIMYTSGSTGEPKGMMHTHKGCVSYARWGALHVSLTADDRVASHAPLHFDLCVFDFFSTSQAGGTVVLVPEPVTKFPASWTQYIEAERITVVFTVPFTLIEMLDHGVMEQRDLTSLRWILFGGEPFPPKYLRALMTKLPAARFTNVYGPAEAPSCTTYEVPPLNEDSSESLGPIPIGRASKNTSVLILDEDDAECDVGEVGELVIRSSTLTRGYWNRPDLNEQIFFERTRPGGHREVYYRSGDLVFRRDDGLLMFVGRGDRMVKTRGHRVELDEVEAALATHPTVSEAGVAAIPDGRGSNVIVAAVSQRGETASDEDELLRHLRNKIPGYALPRTIEVWPTLPRTASGKIDRKRVRDRLVGLNAHEA